MCYRVGLLVDINMVFCELTRFVGTPMSLIVDYNDNNDNNDVLFYVLFLQIGAYNSPLQSK